MKSDEKSSNMWGKKSKGRGEYNVENLKLIRDHHKNGKTYPKGKIILSIYFTITKELVRLITYHTSIYFSYNKYLA